MLIFLAACLALILGYIFYGAFVERVFKASPNRITPALRYTDGVDYVPMSAAKIFLIQFLNIAGLGPVFGAILGALYGPVALIWIVVGSIFAGAVHDYLSGMLSLRYKGRSVTFLMEKFFGKRFKLFFLLFLTFFLVLVGAVFAMNPAKMMADITATPFIYWIVLVFAYYFLATLLPVDKIIGKIYPLFALLLLSVTVLLTVVLFTRGMPFYPELTLENLNPKKYPIFPLMFVTIACGALSGFHATQSPMMARCITNEKYGRPIFYGAMITEGFIALMWTTLGISFYQGSIGLSHAIDRGGAGIVVSEIAKDFLGSTGGFLTVLSVVILSITSGDTAFRSARLNLADFLKYDQKALFKRAFLSVFILSCGIGLCFFDLTTMWMYFGWANQVLATLTLWICTLYLSRKGNYYWMTLLPALFMTAVCTTYLLSEKIGFNLPISFSQILGVICALAGVVLFFFIRFKNRKKRS